MFKKKIKRIITALGLLSFAEQLNFKFQKNREKNKLFKKQNPGIVLPPDFYMYETFCLDYHKYYFEGIDAAKWIINQVDNEIDFHNKNILDWGCGPGRLIRHLPEILDKSNSVYGTDYNSKYVTWCQENLVDVKVEKNELMPPLLFDSEFFDFIYGISIFTHLSSEMHEKWMEELSRVLKPGGLLFLTLHGDGFKNKFNEKELEIYEAGNIVVQNFKVEGNRLYAAYQPPVFFKKLCNSYGFEIKQHQIGGVIKGKSQQDIWLLKKI